MSARQALPHDKASGRLAGLAIALTAFATLIDLFAIQAILPSLARRYGVGAAEIGAAANACTLGMAISSLVTALVAPRLGRRSGVAASLALLALPTATLGFVDDLWSFTALRIAQGALMAAAFTLMLAHLGEAFMGRAAAPAFAAFITGNVLSNLAGRMLSAIAAEWIGITGTFLTFAGLNLAGALLVLLSVDATRGSRSTGQDAGGVLAPLARLLAEPRLRAVFAIGFIILFVFIGVFSYVNFVLARPPLSLGMMQLGWVYLVFLPALPTTLAAGAIAARFGRKRVLLAGLVLALAGLPLLAIPNLLLALSGLGLVAIGTFGAQAVATGLVGHLAGGGAGAASGLYLAAYFSGGLAGSILLGQVFERLGWVATLVAVALAAGIAIAIAARVSLTEMSPRREPGTLDSGEISA